MSVFANVRIDGGDPIQLGAGFVGDESMKPYMSPERWEAEQAALEKEAREAAEALELEKREAEDAERFWALQRGEAPKRTTADVLREYDDATARADRREAARQGLEHRSDCGCGPCGERQLATAVKEAPPRRLAGVVDRENAAAADEFLQRPATVGVVGAMVDNAIAKAARLLGKH